MAFFYTVVPSTCHRHTKVLLCRGSACAYVRIRSSFRLYAVQLLSSPQLSFKALLPSSHSAYELDENPKRLLLNTAANPARGLLNRENKWFSFKSFTLRGTYTINKITLYYVQNKRKLQPENTTISNSLREVSVFPPDLILLIVDFAISRDTMPASSAACGPHQTYSKLLLFFSSYMVANPVRGLLDRKRSEERGELRL